MKSGTRWQIFAWSACVGFVIAASLSTFAWTQAKEEGGREGGKAAPSGPEDKGDKGKGGKAAEGKNKGGVGNQGKAKGGEGDGTKAGEKDKVKGGEKDKEEGREKGQAKGGEKSKVKGGSEGSGGEGAAGAGDEPERGSDEGDEDAAYGPPKPASIDEAYVRDHLESYLHPTELQVLKGGKVRLVFDLLQKDHEQDTAFTPNIGTALDSTFRWTVERDEEWTTYTSGRREPDVVGVKASNSGIALLNCWFTDDVEIAADFQLAATFSRKNTFAVVFANDAKQPLALGNNAGTQCVTYKKGAATKTQGAVEPLIFRNSTKLKLKVLGGQFEAIRDKRSRQKMRYERKDFASGRVGFLWSGGVTGIITGIEVVGTVDWKRMAQELRKKTGK
ncbi:MAG: hypothetical protein HY721_04470 [Planctomycetes bacterium]|nr:hypothetical protein [Planctomycetota bacterium]